MYCLQDAGTSQPWKLSNAPNSVVFTATYTQEAHGGIFVRLAEEDEPAKMLVGICGQSRASQGAKEGLVIRAV